eukprot:scaffold3258_cov168-Amphora_coffeaeformis.AAC.1
MEKNTPSRPSPRLTIPPTIFLFLKSYRSISRVCVGKTNACLLTAHHDLPFRARTLWYYTPSNDMLNHIDIMVKYARPSRFLY